MECKNCSANLQDEDGFCSYCGARVIDERISTKFLIKEILDKVLSVDNKLMKTFWHLFTKPEAVINGYIDGIRKRYYNPFSYLLISITISGIYFYFLKDIYLESINTSSQSGDSFLASIFTEDYLNMISDYQSIFTVMNIPVYGFISWLVFLNRKKYNFFEHLVIYLYAASQTIALSFIVVAPIYLIDQKISGVVSLYMSLFSFVYFSYVLIRLYKLKFWQFIVKTLYFLVVSMFVFLFMGIIMNVIMFMIQGPTYLEKFKPKHLKKKDSIQKVQPIDSLKLQKKDSIKDPKAISYYEASSKLNCLS
ncbi:DUF3667 domain-containing protein [Pseudotenacibaculum haliotis]|uniref:DUF3667 domain-containing protein n=1 Tax=Pseudotenacibaculum haliotis TaxID=1862138 RepID=A0ABW5LZW4_9FLAO